MFYNNSCVANMTSDITFRRKITSRKKPVSSSLTQLTKYSGFKSSVREDATFHSTFISHTQIGGKLENNLNKLLKKRTVHVLRQTTVPTLDH